MRKFLYLSTFICIFLVSCKEENKTEHIEPFKEKSIIQKQSENIVLGEDLEEINAFIKNIYSLNEKVYVEIDVVQIDYKNIDEPVIKNENLKVRTYLIDNNTLINTDDCKEINPSELIKIKNRLLNDKSIIIVGKSENGKMVSINFGCYG